MHTVIEEQEMIQHLEDKSIRWEALREQCMTIGAKDALDRAMRGGHVLFDYLWFILVVGLLLIALHKWVEDVDNRDPGSGSHIPAEVKGGRDDNMR